MFCILLVILILSVSGSTLIRLIRIELGRFLADPCSSSAGLANDMTGTPTSAVNDVEDLVNDVNDVATDGCCCFC